MPFNAPVDLLGAYAIPAIGRVFMVRGDGTNVTSYDEQYTQLNPDANRRLYPSVATALALCVASRGDTILVLPGHTENLAAAATSSWTFKAGVRIIGLGQGSSIPTFTMTTATSKLNLNAVNIGISGCRFLCAGPAGTTALTVVAPFTMSAIGCSLIGNEFEVGIDADQLCTTFLTVSAARCTFSYNQVESQSVASTPTAGIVIGGADKFMCEGNWCKAAFAAAATGWITHTSACADITIRKNFFWQWLASSSGGINLAGNFVTTGIIADNYLKTNLTTNVLPIVTSGTGVVVHLFNNYVVNDSNQTGVLVGTVSDAS
jgi:hypothetical protein